MKLPQELQHFPKATLIVASDTVQAKFLLVGAEDLEELDGVSVPKEKGADGEGSIEFFPNDAERLHAFVHAVVERIETLVRDHAIAHVHMVMPAEIEHEVSGHLANDVKEKIGKTVHHDVMKESYLDIVKRVVAQLGIAS